MNNNAAVNFNDMAQVRRVDLNALRESLAVAGRVRFIQQYESGRGDYTQEKYQRKELSLSEIDELLRKKQK
ncbi:MAG: hypothetical protein LBV16_04685 [Elusimicrobiota bacterium]|jgi:hypothetical protein|nr:hypothetical protein [Elusimicrobiota bacterium]